MGANADAALDCALFRALRGPIARAARTLPTGQRGRGPLGIAVLVTDRASDSPTEQQLRIPCVELSLSCCRPEHAARRRPQARRPRPRGCDALLSCARRSAPHGLQSSVHSPRRQHRVRRARGRWRSCGALRGCSSRAEGPTRPRGPVTAPPPFASRRPQFDPHLSPRTRRCLPPLERASGAIRSAKAIIWPALRTSYSPAAAAHQPRAAGRGAHVPPRRGPRAVSASISPCGSRRLLSKAGAHKNDSNPCLRALAAWHR